MDNREIIVANTKTQKRSKITTNATTLGELKEAFDNAGIDYSGMTFTEGISKTQLLDDDTQLPQNIMYKGQPTNNLVILLTNTKKNISSGIYAGDRKACYSIIKENNLQEAVKEEFGRNFTQVPTSDLQRFIEENTEDNTTDTETEDTCNIDIPHCVEDNEENITVDTDKITKALLNFIVVLKDEGILDKEEVAAVERTLSIKTGNNVGQQSSKSISTSDGSINDDDIDDMLEDLGI